MTIKRLYTHERHSYWSQANTPQIGVDSFFSFLHRFTIHGTGVDERQKWNSHKERERIKSTKQQKSTIITGSRLYCLGMGMHRAATVAMVVVVVSTRHLISSLFELRRWLNESIAGTEQSWSLHVLPADELHYSPEVEHLPLFDWERASAFPPRICSPPQGIPQYCCLGSASLGGEVTYMDHLCVNNPDDMVSG